MYSKGEAVRVVIVANAPVVADPRLLNCIDDADYLIAADGGGLVLHAIGRAPQLLIGDLDSIDARSLTFFTNAGTDIRQYPREKNETDLELALLAAVSIGAHAIELFCVLGGRWDHTLATIAMLSMPMLADIRVQIYADGQVISLIRDAAVIRGAIGDIVSLLPMTPTVNGITTNGLAYPLSNATLYFERSRGVSNVLTQEEARVVIGDGLLLLVQSIAVSENQL
jgi:thiamine pyrophosphokinase